MMRDSIFPVIVESNQYSTLTPPKTNLKPEGHIIVDKKIIFIKNRTGNSKQYSTNQNIFLKRI